MTHTFKFHKDPGHGWLQVSRYDLANVRLTVAAFSGCSYIERVGSEVKLYLEEDCDLALFAQAYENKHGQTVPMETIYHDNDCFIRNLKRISGVSS